MTSSSAPLESEKAIQVRASITRLRFLGYVGVQFSALLVPLLVFQLTGSAGLAGAALLVEWVPKLAVYVAGGSLTQRYAPAGVHLGLELARVAALVALLGAALGVGNVWLVGAAAAVYQCANAFSNILFERAVTQWWEPTARVEGHSALLQRDLMGCLLALSVALLLAKPAFIAAVALGVQSWGAALVLRARRTIYSREQVGSCAVGLGTQLVQDLRCVARPPLLRFAGTALLITLPSATVLSAAIFYLQRAGGAQSDPGRWLSALLLVRVVVSASLLHAAGHWLRHRVPQHQMALGGMTAIVCATLLLALPNSGPWWVAACAIVTVGAGGVLYVPWLRHERQSLIVSLVPQENQKGATGLLIAVEVCSYLAGAALLMALGAFLGELASLLALAGLLGMALALRTMRPR